MFETGRRFGGAVALPRTGSMVVGSRLDPGGTELRRDREVVPRWLRFPLALPLVNVILERPEFVIRSHLRPVAEREPMIQIQR